MPTTGQILLLILAILLFSTGGLLSLARTWWDRETLRIAAKACLWCGVAVSLGVLLWHMLSRPGGSWIPLEDNFEAFVWLAVLLTGFVLYVQRTRPLGGLDWFVMPIVILLLIAAGVLGKAKPQEYVGTTWYWIHLSTVLTGALAFAIAGATGAMYLQANRRLRSKSLPQGPKLGSLERLERITFTSVTLGFALLTIGLITGLVVLKARGQSRLGDNWFASPKVLLAFAAWVVYAIVLHAPINPSFRGRKVALLSIFGFVLMIGTLVAVNFVPAGGGAH
ncbi:MAG: resC ccsA 3 [Phycisphaerales bacterium]|nr:resC ccsA 3 [Phycisphaerales bacterium]